MIIAAILVLVGIVFAYLGSVLVNSSSFDFSAAVSVANIAFGWISRGASFIKTFFIVPELFDILVGSYLAVLSIYEAYKFAMWVMQKVPMFGVSD